MASNKDNNTPAQKKGNKNDKDKGPTRKMVLITPRSVPTLNNLFKMDEVLRRALNQMGCELQISMDGDNTAVRILDPNGKAAGSVADIAKIANFRNEIQKFMKSSESEAFMEPIRHLVYNLVEEIMKTPGSGKAVALNESAKSLLRDLAVKLDRVLYNMDLLMDWSPAQASEDDDICTAIMLAWCARIHNVIMGCIRKMVTGVDTKSHIADQLRAERIPKWAYDKLTGTKIDSFNTVQVYSILFPENNEKMRFNLTASEMADEKFCTGKELDYLLSGSQYQITIIRDGALLKIATGSEEDVDFNDEVNTVGNQLKGEKVEVTPPNITAEEIYSKGNSFKFKSFCGGSNLTSAKGALTAVLEVGLAFQTGNFRSGDNVSNYYDLLKTDIVFSAEIKKRKGLRPALENLVSNKKFKDAIEENLNFSDEAEERFKSLVPVLLGLRGDHPLVAAINKKFSDFESISVDELLEALAPKGPDSQTAVDKRKAGLAVLANSPALGETIGGVRAYQKLLRKAPEGETALKKEAEFLKTITLNRVPKVKSTKIATGSLVKSSRELIKSFQDQGGEYEAVADSLSDWLRGIGSVYIQSFAARLISANFDTVFNIDVEDENEDDSGDKAADADLYEDL